MFHNLPPKSNSMDHKPNNNCYSSTKRVSISILVISLPLLYASLLHIPLSSLLRDTTFWFLISNSIVVVVAADSGMFDSSPSSSSSDDLYDEYIQHSRAKRKCYHGNSLKEDKGLPTVETVNLEDEESCNTTPGEDLISVQVNPTCNPDRYRHTTMKVEEAQPMRSSSTSGEQLGSTPTEDLIPVRTDPGTKFEQVTSREYYHDTSLKGEESLNLREEELHNTPAEDLNSMPLGAIGNENEEDIVLNQLPKCHRSLLELSPEKTREKNLIRRSKTGMETRSCGMEESEYWKLSDEELNRRVEEFIRRFNREIRLQERMCTSVC